MQNIRKESKPDISDIKPSLGDIFQVHFNEMTSDPVTFMGPHIHDFIEILYCLQGGSFITVDGYETRMSCGDMAVITSGQVHTRRPHTLPERCLVVKFQPEMISSCSNTPRELQYVFPFILSGLKDGFVIRAAQLENTALPKLFMTMASEISEEAYGYEILLKSGIYQIILWLIRNVMEKSDLADTYSENTVRKIASAISYIESHYAQQLSVRQVAANAFMEYTYFSRTFKQITKMSCSEYINKFRIQKAEALLLSTKLSITEISDQAGFDNVSYFIKQFRRLKGISPKQYQKKLFYFTNSSSMPHMPR